MRRLKSVPLRARFLVPVVLLSAAGAGCSDSEREENLYIDAGNGSESIKDGLAGNTFQDCTAHCRTDGLPSTGR